MQMFIISFCSESSCIDIKQIFLRRDYFYERSGSHFRGRIFLIIFLLLLFEDSCFFLFSIFDL
jgi:hypothetical protein